MRNSSNSCWCRFTACCQIEIVLTLSHLVQIYVLFDDPILFCLYFFFFLTLEVIELFKPKLRGNFFKLNIL
jgi:hypothetical protein